MAAFTDLLPEVLPDVPGCADLLAERAIRNAAITFCERSKIYRADLDPIDVEADESTYAVPLPAGYALVDIRRALCNDQPLERVSQDRLDQIWRDDQARVRYTLYHQASGDGFDADSWQAATSAQPRLYFQPDKEHIRLVGIPTQAFAAGLVIYAALKPTPSATEIADWVYHDHFRTLAFGALAELLKLPQKPWTEPVAAREYEARFREGIAAATGEALRDHGRNDRPTGRVRSYV